MIYPFNQGITWPYLQLITLYPSVPVSERLGKARLLILHRLQAC